MVRIIPAGILRQYVPGQESPVQGEWAGRPVRQVIEELGIPPLVVGAVLVNGRLVQKEHLLQEGDEVKLIALIGGG